jgi:hypothetical protein
MKRRLAAGAVCAAALVLPVLLPGCGSDDPAKDVDHAADYATGKTPLDQGGRMKKKLDGIGKKREEQFEKAAGK